jgi:hypothetical protein
VPNAFYALNSTRSEPEHPVTHVCTHSLLLPPRHFRAAPNAVRTFLPDSLLSVSLSSAPAAAAAEVAFLDFLPGALEAVAEVGVGAPDGPSLLFPNVVDSGVGACDPGVEPIDAGVWASCEAGACVSTHHWSPAIVKKQGRQQCGRGQDQPHSDYMRSSSWRRRGSGRSGPSSVFAQRPRPCPSCSCRNR